ncbi:paraquat-inducible protein A [Roseivirga echinicomitans]
MNKRNAIAFVLIIVSLACLYPGLTKPIIQINIGAQLPLIGEFKLFERTQSIVESIQSLFETNNDLVAWLILIFSIIVPIVKAIILLSVLAFKNLPGRKALYRFVGLIGKWSMADVFVVGILLAFLATGENESIRAELFEGFNYFLAYCIISILAIQVMDVKTNDLVQ